MIRFAKTQLTVMAALLLAGMPDVSHSVAAQTRTSAVEEKIRTRIEPYLQKHGLADFPLAIVGRPDLQDALVNTYLAMHPNSKELPAILDFYSITLRRFGLSGLRVVSFTAELDEELQLIVAVGQDDTILLLAGFPDGHSNFLQLLPVMNIAARTENEALDIFNLFLILAGGEALRSSVVGDEMHLKALALEDFRLRFSRANGLAKFRLWLKREYPELRRKVVAPYARRIGTNFEVFYWRYSQGKLERKTMLIPAKT